MVKTILFLCGHNAGRSQMAQAFFNHLNNHEDFIGESAGTNIADEINQQCVEAMQEIGINMSDPKTYYPKVFDKDQEYYKVFSMGCNVQCDLNSDKDLGVDDPAGKPVEEVRKIREDVKLKIKKIIEGLNG